ncbi:hypothetical protein M514_03610 [Trichuris suis]|uniref:RRM domain-containing protein n=1 Tax=Trichuris suis TaxID=68888 RepID=A0A085N0J0_9BILA|nr:hypothetical protein M513_03610 [Trichuris suis]KFD62986.1 hypothetical protein M514_03610 [Trichuris suis]
MRIKRDCLQPFEFHITMRKHAGTKGIAIKSVAALKGCSGISVSILCCLQYTTVPEDSVVRVFVVCCARLRKVMSSYSSRSENRIYVGNLPPEIRSRQLDDFFQKFGKIAYVDLKNRKGPPFAFIEFEDHRDAEDAVRCRDGYDWDGYKLRVEFPRGSGSQSGMRGRSNFGRSGGGPSRHTNYRVLVTGLPPTGSWQDLKDHMREAGDVCYADVFNDGTGVVEYLREDDMKYALKKLNDSKFRSHEGEVSYIRVREDDGSSRARSRSRSPLRVVRDSPTYSPRSAPALVAVRAVAVEDLEVRTQHIVLAVGDYSLLQP